MRSYPTINVINIKTPVVDLSQVSKNHFDLIEKNQNSIELMSIYDLQYCKFDRPECCGDKVKEFNYRTTSVHAYRHPLYLNNITAFLGGKAEPDTDGIKFLKSQKESIAGYHQVRSGKSISLLLEY